MWTHIIHRSALYMAKYGSNLTSGQDGGIGRHTLLPHITERGTTNLKRKNNQNCQKIELYGSPTTKELKKKHSSRQVAGAEMGNQDGKYMWQGCTNVGQTHICAWISQEEQLGSKTDHATQSSRVGK